MKNNKRYITALIVSVVTFSLHVQGIVQLCGKNSHYHYIRTVFSRFDIESKKIKKLNSESDKLHIIFDISKFSLVNLPQHYIICQTQKLDENSFTQEMLNCFSQAVCIWDSNFENLALYKKHEIYHYYYFPENYEYEDPIILSCLVPADALSIYKDILIYSNKLDSDISSHLPILFVRSLLNSPWVFLEVGVSSGQSTYSFSRVLNYCKSHSLVGIDIFGQWAASYADIEKARFICMDDMQFSKLKEFKNKKFTPIFIDTSHEYQHTLDEIKLFLPYLDKNGLMIFHDSNVTPFANGTVYTRINGTSGEAHGNTRGVTEALKEYFELSFDEMKYYNSTFIKDGIKWNIIHYPFCNGMTYLEKIEG